MGNEESWIVKAEVRPKRSLSLVKIAPALIKAQGMLQNVVKSGKSLHGSYAKLDTTWDAIREILHDCEIYIYQRPMLLGEKTVMCTMLLHSSGEFFDDSELELKSDSGARMNPMQALGSAITYARRYCLQSALGIAPTDVTEQATPDDDGNSAFPAAFVKAREDRERVSASFATGPIGFDGQQHYQGPDEIPFPNFDEPVTVHRIVKEDDPGSYVIVFGKKYSGRRLDSIPATELLSWVEYLEKTAREAKKPLAGKAEEAVHFARAYLQLPSSHP